MRIGVFYMYTLICICIEDISLLHIDVVLYIVIDIDIMNLSLSF